MAANDLPFPSSFYCALTLKVMKDPVIDPEGHTYERSAIEEWLTKSQNSPMTRSALKPTDLVPNRALREAIESAVSLRGTAPASSPAPTTASSPVSVSASASGAVELAMLARAGELLVSAQPPAQGARCPADICCVIDVSGSMCRNATLQNDAGGVEEFDIDLLDVVKHSVKTIINMLEPSDRLSLVSFSSDALLCLSPTAMNPAGRRRAETALAEMTPNGSTNLWAGLQLGLDTLRQAKQPASGPRRLKTVILLTDGLPNVAPPRGYLPTLQRYLAKHPDFLCSVNTFGFGYSLDSELLSQIAVLGNGSYAFIPDSGFVGTIFVNFLANTLSTVSAQLFLSLAPQNGVVFPPALPGGYPVRAADASLIVSLGSCQYAQSRDCLFRYTLPDGFDATLPIAQLSLEYYPNNSAPLTITKPVFLSNPASASASPSDSSATSLNDPLDAMFAVQKIRLEMVDTIRTAVSFNPVTRNANDECIVDATRLPESRALVAKFIADISNALPADTPLFGGYLKDLSGQVTQALSREDWYLRWGQHYLPSLIFAHLAQQCNNFKDPGVQAYGQGKLFTLLQEEADDVFLKLPPPSRKIASMEVFNNQSGGCFAGYCDVLLADGRTKRVDRIRRGDLLSTPEGQAAVRCVVRTTYPALRSMMCRLEGGLVITAWHPISLDGGRQWVFPNAVVPPRKTLCQQVYTFVLDQHHTVNINGVDCVTLGHSFQEDIRAHPYFGSPRVIHDLQQFPQWESGLIDLTPDSFQKSSIVSHIIRN